MTVSPRPPALPKTCTSFPTALVKLSNLHGCLQKFNGSTAPIRKWSDDGRWIIELKGVQLLLDQTLLARVSEPFEDAVANKENFKKHFQNNEMSGHNRGNVKHAMEAVGSAIRRQIHKHSKAKGITRRSSALAIFREYDADSNGVLDQQEFAVFLSKLGVKISTSEHQLIWKLFDRDQSGGINFQEFLNVINPGLDPTYHKPEFIEQMEKVSKTARTHRISAASQQTRSRLGSLSNVSSQWKKKRHTFPIARHSGNGQIRSGLPVLNTSAHAHRPRPPTAGTQRNNCFSPVQRNRALCKP